MEFVNIPFPDRLAFGSEGGPEWQTLVDTNIGGFDSTNQDWEDARHRYDVSFAVRVKSDYLDIKAHHTETRGRARSFPFKDYLDFEVASTEGVILTTALASISANGTYYLHKKYGSTNPWYRRITRPDSTLTSVIRTRSGTPTNILGSGATVTYSTGAVAITGHQSGDTYTWSGTFKVPCRYDIDKLPGLIVNKQPGTAGELFVRCDAIPLVEVRE